MVRAPTKTCPNLFRLFEGAEPRLLSAFLQDDAFSGLSWLERYRFDPADPDGSSTAGEMVRRESRDRLSPLEGEAARIATIAASRGQYALEGLAKTKLGAERAKLLLSQRDEVARSLWAYINEFGLFEAAENSLHLRLYRRYDKHYQTLMSRKPSVEQSA